MADPRSFISFDFDNDKTHKELFAGQAKNSKTPFSIEDWSSKSELPQSEWEKLIKEKMVKCHLMIVLVGKYMGSANGVKKVIKMATEQNVPFFGVYVNGADSSSTLPDGLARNRTIAWSWDNIASAIEQMKKEGKNK